MLPNWGRSSATASMKASAPGAPGPPAPPPAAMVWRKPAPQPPTGEKVLPPPA